MPPLTAIPFRIVRMPLLQNVVTPVEPPSNFTCSSVAIINTIGDDLRIITSADGTEYGILSSNFERLIWLPQAGAVASTFRAGATVFWLDAAVNGTAILIWS